MSRRNSRKVEKYRGLRKKLREAQESSDSLSSEKEREVLDMMQKLWFEMSQEEQDEVTSST